MMKCDFSELQFSYGVMHELTTKYFDSTWKMPFFPTQRKETELGYDVKIQGPVVALFLQFKVSQYCKSNNAKYMWRYQCPYYRFDIWRDDISHQHNLLVELGKKSVKNKVFYCAPYFYTLDEINKFYENTEIVKNCIFIPCKDLPTIYEYEEHDICYAEKWGQRYQMHSIEFGGESLTIEKILSDMDESEMYMNLNECLREVTEHFSVKIDNSRESPTERYMQVATHLLTEYDTLFAVAAKDDGKSTEL